MARTKRSGGLEASIKTEELRLACSRLKAVAESSSTVPSVACALIVSEEGKLNISAYDLEVGITTMHEATIDKPGSVAVPAKLLRQIVDGAPDEYIKLEALENHRLRLRSGEMESEIAGLNPDECTACPVPDRLRLQPVDGAALRELIEATRAAVCTDETRPNLCGALLERIVEGWRMVSTDGHQLSLIDRHVEDQHAKALGGQVFLLTKFLDVLHKLLSDEESIAGELAFTKAQVIFQREGLQLVSRLPDDNFPAYREVLPDASFVRSHAHVSRGQIRRAIERLLPIANKATHHVVLSLGNNRLRLRAESVDYGFITEVMPIEYEGQAIVIGASSAYLINALDAVSSEFVTIEITDSQSPIIVRPKDSKLQLYLLMPRVIDQRDEEAILEEDLAEVFPHLRDSFREQNRKLRALEEARRIGREAGKAAWKEHGGPLESRRKKWPAKGDWTEVETQLGRPLPEDERDEAEEAFWEAAFKPAPAKEEKAEAMKEEKAEA